MANQFLAKLSDSQVDRTLDRALASNDNELIRAALIELSRRGRPIEV